LAILANAWWQLRLQIGESDEEELLGLRKQRLIYFKEEYLLEK